MAKIFNRQHQAYSTCLDVLISWNLLSTAVRQRYHTSVWQRYSFHNSLGRCKQWGKIQEFVPENRCTACCPAARPGYTVLKIILLWIIILFISWWYSAHRKAGDHTGRSQICSAGGAPQGEGKTGGNGRPKALAETQTGRSTNCPP